jgi:hypothetical protein
MEHSRKTHVSCTACSEFCKNVRIDRLSVLEGILDEIRTALRDDRLKLISGETA